MKYKHIVFTIFLAVIYVLFSSNSYALTTIGFEKLFINGEKYDKSFIVENDEIYITEENINLIYYGYTILYNKESQTVIISGKETAIKINEYQGVIYYPLLAITHELGYTSNWDYRNKRIYVDTKTINPQQSTENNIYQNRTKRPKRGLFIKLFKEEPIKDVVEEVTAIRIYANLINTRVRTIRKAQALCIFYLSDGREYYRDEQIIDNIKPGETKRVIFFTTNPDTKKILTYKMTCSEIKK